jgi:hypothetical protein
MVHHTNLLLLPGAAPKHQWKQSNEEQCLQDKEQPQWPLPHGQTKALRNVGASTIGPNNACSCIIYTKYMLFLTHNTNTAAIRSLDQSDREPDRSGGLGWNPEPLD